MMLSEAHLLSPVRPSLLDPDADPETERHVFLVVGWNNAANRPDFKVDYADGDPERDLFPSYRPIAWDGKLHLKSHEFYVARVVRIRKRRKRRYTADGILRQAITIYVTDIRPVLEWKGPFLQGNVIARELRCGLIPRKREEVAVDIRFRDYRYAGKVIRIAECHVSDRLVARFKIDDERQDTTDPARLSSLSYDEFRSLGQIAVPWETLPARTVRTRPWGETTPATVSGYRVTDRIRDPQVVFPQASTTP